jgi:hypothetical protein
VRHAPQEGVERGNRFITPGDDEDQAMIQVRTPHTRGMGDVAEIQRLRRGGQEVAVRAGELREGLGGPRRNRDEDVLLD